MPTPTQVRGTTQVKAGTVTKPVTDSTVIAADGSRAFTGDQSMGSHKIVSVTDPSSAQDAATKAYVDSKGDIRADGTVPFTADQSMGSHKLTNVTDPTNAQDAATRAYVDAKATKISVLTNGDPVTPELMWDSNGDVIMTVM